MAIIVFPKSWSSKPPPGAQIKTGYPLSQGLLGCWLLNEGGGTGASDIASALNGTLGSGATWDVQGVTCSPTTGNISIPASPLFSIAVQSWVAWFKVRSFGVVSPQELVSVNNNSNDFRFRISDTAIDFIANGAGINYSASVTITPGIWYQIAVTAGAGGSKIFFNTAIVATDGTALVAPGASGVTRLGGYSTSENFDGVLGSVLAYNRVLLQDDIIQLYQSPYSFMQPQSPQMRYWAVSAPAPPASDIIEQHVRLGEYGQGMSVRIGGN